MQVIRLVDMPDRLIAFDELPESMLDGIDMLPPTGLPRHWREFLGKRKKFIRILPERDPYTGQMRKFEPLVEEGPFFFVIDRTVNNDEEKWQEISNYVRRMTPKEFRLKDRIEDMAIPMAVDVKSELNIEPEQIPVIPLVKEVKEEPMVSAPVIVKDEAKPVIESATATVPVRHGLSCETKGRAGQYTKGCARCEYLQARHSVPA
jgi:hypothetical protein